MKISAGIIIKWKEKILLCHPTGKSWSNTYTPPKGGVNSGEKIKDAAIRETFEETGIKIDEAQLVNEPILIEYHSEKNKIYKNVWLYTLVIEDLTQIGLSSEVVPEGQLQKEELDWGGFLSKEEAQGKLFWRYEHIFDIP